MPKWGESELSRKCVDQLYDFYSIPIIDIPNNLGVNDITYTTYVNSDKLHFSDDGVNAVATCVAHQIMAM